MLNCSLDIPQVAGLVDNEITVGRVFYLTCEGVLDKNFNSADLQLNFLNQENMPHVIKVLSAQARNAALLDLKVVSYQVGRHELQAVKLSDGRIVYDLNWPTIDVKSVIKPDQPVQKPFGPYGPVDLKLSVEFWFILAALILAVTGSLVGFIIKKRETKNRLQKVKEFDYAIAAKDQFFRDLRTLKRNYLNGGASDQSQTSKGLVQTSYVQAYELLEKSFFIYLTRKFLSLPFEWSLSKLFKFLKKSKMLKADQTKELKIILSEIEKLRTLKSNNKLEAYDLKNLIYRLENWVEEVEK